MALAQIYTAEAGHIITAARWNNEFGNIYTNGTDVAFPLTKAVSLAGWTLTLDAAGATTLVSPATTGFLFTTGTKSGTPGVNGGIATFAAGTYQDTDTAASGTAALWTGVSIRASSLEANNVSVTTTRAATLYIANAPTASTNETITNPYALLVDDGKVQFDGALQVSGVTTLTGGLVAASGDPYSLTNLTLAVTMAANATTIALKTNAGTDPSSTDKVSVRFRNGTLATGGTTNIDITSALSVVIPSGATLGTVDAIARRIYIGLINNDGTAELFVYNPLGTNGDLRGLSESALLTTTTIADTADSAQVAYSTTGRATKAFRIIGFFESTQATAGTWSTAASTIQELQPWMPRTGHILATAVAVDTASNPSRTAQFALDDTNLSSANGAQISTINYTPTNACNVIEIDTQSAGLGIVSDASIIVLILGLFTNLSVNNLIADTPIRAGAGATSRGTCKMKYRSGSLGTMTSAQVRGGASTIAGADVWFNNGAATTSDLNESFGTYISVTEIMA